MHRITHNKTKKLSSKGWSALAPGTRERIRIKKKCGSKCFLGPETSFPVCAKGSCNINTKGIYAAYVRAREYGSKKMHRRSKRSSSKRSSSKRSSSKRSSKRKSKRLYQSIAARAKRMLQKLGYGPNLQ